MYSNGYSYPISDWAKWLVLLGFSVLVLLGSVLAMFAAGTFSPKTAAEARRMDAETAAYQAQVQEKQQRDAVDAKIYEASQQAQLQAQKNQLAAQVEFEKQRNAKELAKIDQEMAQAEQSSQVQSAMLDWGGRVLVAGVALALVIVATGSVFKRPAYQTFRAQPAPANTTHLNQSDIELGRVNNRIQVRLDQLHIQLADVQKQLSQTQKDIILLKTRGNGSGTHGELYTADNVIPFKPSA